MPRGYRGSDAQCDGRRLRARLRIRVGLDILRAGLPMNVDARLSKKDCDELARRIEALESDAGATAAARPKSRLDTIEQIVLVVTAVDYAYRFTFKMAPSTWKKIRRWVEKRRALAGAPESPSDKAAPRRRSRGPS